MTTKEELRIQAKALFPHLPRNYWDCELLIAMLHDLNYWRTGKCSDVPDNAWARWHGVGAKAKLKLVAKK